MWNPQCFECLEKRILLWRNALMWKSWMQYPCEWSHNKGLSCSNLLNLSSSQIHVKITGVDDLAKINFTFKVLQSCQYLVSQASSSQISSFFYETENLWEMLKVLVITQTFSLLVSQNIGFCKQNSFTSSAFRSHYWQIKIVYLFRQHESPSLHHRNTVNQFECTRNWWIVFHQR